MENKTSKSIAIFSIIEILVGVFTIALYFLLIAGSFYGQRAEGDQSGFNINKIATLMATLILSIIILIAGIGSIKFKYWAWKANVYLIPICLFVVYTLWAIIGYWTKSIIALAPFLLFIPFETYFLTRTEIRGQFK